MFVWGFSLVCSNVELCLLHKSEGSFVRNLKFKRVEISSAILKSISSFISELCEAGNPIQVPKKIFFCESRVVLILAI